MNALSQYTGREAQEAAEAIKLPYNELKDEEIMRPNTRGLTRKFNRPAAKYSTQLDSQWDTKDIKKEIASVKKQIQENAKICKPKPQGPFTPNLTNTLGPYRNSYLLELMEEELPKEFASWGQWGQRNTAQNIVEPEISWKMDNVTLFTTSTNTEPKKWKKWSKNLSGNDPSQGSTRLPPISDIKIKRIKNPNYQHFKMKYDNVPQFRKEVGSIMQSYSADRAKSDYSRTMKDWERMNLAELRELNPQHLYHVAQNIKAYLGSSEGSAKAVKELTKKYGMKIVT